MRFAILLASVFVGTSLFTGNVLSGQNSGSWTIPAGGNSFRLKAEGSGARDAWQSSDESILFFFKVDKRCNAELSLNLSVPEGKSEIKVSVGKKNYTNQWCRDKNGKWFPLAKARFTADDIARRGYRMDYAGGTEDRGFFLQNGGFFDANTAINSIFELKSAPVAPPEIDFGTLKWE